jgi:hypothetical protein
MKKLILLVLLALSSVAHAACKPASIDAIRIGSSVDGVWAYWWCPAVPPAAKTLEFRGILTKDVTPAQVTAVRAYEGGTNPGLIDQVPVVGVDHPTMVNIRASVLAAAATDPERPSAPVAASVVAPQGTSLTRSAFPVIAGKRSFSSTSRATVGAPCDCSTLKFVEGLLTYCQVAPATVTVCTKP